jgi:RimJ/RimL family protein N-acetyltransferase
LPSPVPSLQHDAGSFRQTLDGERVAGMSEARLFVRELREDEIGLRIDYFHSASDEHLERLGVARELLPDPVVWRSYYEQDYRRPIELRREYALAWELDGAVVGFTTADRITYGSEAFMHLHLIDESHRHAGLGARFVARSVPRYFEALALQRLLCEPNALNVAPNRTLQRAGFRYEMSHHTVPGPLNPPQLVTRWRFERGWLADSAGTG